MRRARGSIAAASPEFNVGIDLESVERFAAVFDDPLKRALFSPEELEDCASVDDLTGVRTASRLAATWCAKEAAVKALWPWVRLDPRRVVVTETPDGRPAIRVTGWNAVDAGLTMLVRIAEVGSHAAALVIAWGPPPVYGRADHVRR